MSRQPSAPFNDGADDKKHDINKIMFTIDIRAGFFNKGKVFN